MADSRANEPRKKKKPKGPTSEVLRASELTTEGYETAVRYL